MTLFAPKRGPFLLLTIDLWSSFKKLRARPGKDLVGSAGSLEK
jgi:hypothetical protein